MEVTLYNWEKTIHLIRGLPGSGKSSLALTIVGSRRQVVENDDYWYDGDEYRYIDNFVLKRMAGCWCGAEAFRRLRRYKEVAVPNVFHRRSTVFEWVDNCRYLGVEVKLHTPTTAWARDPEACAKMNVHRAPLAAIERMLVTWDDITQAEIDERLHQQFTVIEPLPEKPRRPQ